MCTTLKFKCIFRSQFSPDAVGRRRPALRLRSFPRGCPPQAKIFSKKIKINDFLYEIYYFHRFYLYILIEILYVSWKIWGFHEKQINTSKVWKFWEIFWKFFCIKIFRQKNIFWFFKKHKKWYFENNLKKAKKDKMIFQSPWDSGSFPPLRSDFLCVESCLIKILKPDRWMSRPSLV